MSFLSDNLDDNLFDSGYKQVIQKGSDLGEKMYNAIEFVLKEVPGKVILTGVDIPGLDFQIITEAFERLSQNDIVIGPANDGGYYLIGMKTPVKFLFENMQWSNENVLKNTIDRLKKEKMSFYLLEKLCDIDNADDLKNLKHEL
ncbi:MAG: TIGR04282 family arsenosugar biosynthesis glycosyltransferase [Ignavibacteria bacterium]|nr:TIGR04282 family arsenosugar biosynthesis glycosyltransferase [Ignavibacteria bacterium]